MKLLKRLLEAGLPLARGKVLQRICIGLGYTAVELSEGLCGLAFTWFEPGCCELLPRETSFWDRPADLVLKGLLSPHPLERTVALAVLNALGGSRPQPFLSGDLLESLNLDREDQVAMIGYFEPLVRKLSGKVKTLWIFEREERVPGFYSESDLPRYLPEANLVLISATTLLNQTLEDLLSLIKKAREVVLLGPSTPLFPEAFRFTPITLLSGIRVRSPEFVFRQVAQAKGFPSLREGLEKVNLRI